MATSTHGSSLKYGSLSSQLLALELVAANGTLLSLSRDTHPHLFKAAAASLGRLGVVTRLTLRIKKQLAVTRSLQARGRGGAHASALWRLPACLRRPACLLTPAPPRTCLCLPAFQPPANPSPHALRRS